MSAGLGIPLEELGSDGLLALAQAEGTPEWKAALRCIEAELASERAALEDRPEVSEDGRRDARGRARYIAALRWVIELPPKAKAIISTHIGEET